MPLLLTRGLILLFCWIILQSSPTSGSDGHNVVSDCPSCALGTLSKNVPSSQPEMVEAVKKHILNMLHLRDRPNITQPVPKAALLNAIKKLHVGKVREDGNVEIENDIGRRTEKNELMEQTSEIITFAESGGCYWKWGGEGSTMLLELQLTFLCNCYILDEVVGKGKSVKECESLEFSFDCRYFIYTHQTSQ